jgi:olefin beta-lactone synthetase
MTEALPVTDITLNGIDAAGMGDGICVGRPLHGVEVRLSPLEPDGTATTPPISTAGVTGEVCVRGPHVKDRYDRLWATEHDSSRNPGWHRTGDVGHLDGEGRLWVEGRLVHVITTASGPVTPVGIEQRVQDVKEVTAAAAVGVGPSGTQQVVLVVVAREERTGRAATSALVHSPLAPAPLAAAVRDAAGCRIAAVLVTDALPVDIRHASKIDRLRVAAWADRVLAGRSARRRP